ncbi:MAG: phosphate/phosphite/phosphonate ABC transporter substrate-binding protein [Candidatus Cloacimonadota bacterium]|nr:phosphate/phosphite/phosphonate ABC transporter substrate-binding protein [Candidatus Cloacimonadota bacterium]
MKFKYLVISFFVLMLVASCGPKGPLGSAENPIKMYFVPSVEAGKIVTSATEIAELLNKETGYFFKVEVPLSYAAVIEAMGTEEADLAFLSTFAYILAKDNFDVNLALQVMRYGKEFYRGQFITRKDSGINNLEDIHGKVIGYTDVSSTSGYVYPASLLKSKDIKPKAHTFAGGHEQAVLSLYQGGVDVACTYWSPPRDGISQDARKRLIPTIPDVIEKTKIIGFTEWIPNGTVTFRKEFPSNINEEISNAFIKIIKTKRGHKIMSDLYNIDGFVKTDDSTYDIVRKTLKEMNFNPDNFID